MLFSVKERALIRPSATFSHAARGRRGMTDSVSSFLASQISYAIALTARGWGRILHEGVSSGASACIFEPETHRHQRERDDHQGESETRRDRAGKGRNDADADQRQCVAAKAADEKVRHHF